MPIQHKPVTHYPLAITLALLGAFSMATMSVFVKKLGAGFHWSEILFIRLFISFLLLLPLLVRDRHFTWKIKKPAWLIARVIGGSGSMALYFVVLNHLNLANATLLVMSAPIYVPLLAKILLRTNTNSTVWAGIIIAMLGIILVLHPDRHLFQWYAILGIASGILQAVANLATRKSHEYLSTHQILFWYYLLSLIVLAMMLPFHWQTPTLHQTMYLAGIAFFGWLFTTFYTLTFRYAPSRFISPFSLTSVIFAGFYDWLFWSGIPGTLSMIGIAILLMGLFAVILGKKDLIEPKTHYVKLPE